MKKQDLIIRQLDEGELLSKFGELLGERLRPLVNAKQRTQSNPLITIAQACEMLHVSRSTLYRLISSGDVPCLKAGRRVLFRQNAIENLLITKNI